MVRLLRRTALWMLVPSLAFVGGGSVNAWAQSGYFYNSPTGNYLSGMEALNALDSDEAAERLGAAVREAKDDPVVLSRAFLSALVAGRITQSQDLAREVLAAEPNDELAMLALGTIALEERRYTSAIDRLGGVSENSIVGITGTVMRAWAQLGQGDSELAIATLDRLSENGFGEFLVLHQALIAERAGNQQAAIEYAREAYEIDPGVARTVEAYARILANAGRFEQAGQVLDDYAQAGGNDPLIEMVRGPITDGQRPGPFVQTVQQGAVELLHGLGSALAQDGSRELGVVMLRLALYLDPDFGLSNLRLAAILAQAEQFEAANAALARIDETSPLHTTSLIARAENLDAAGDREGAIAQLETLVADQSENREALGVLGDTLRMGEQWTRAAQIYSRLIDLLEPDNSPNWRYYYVRGIAYERAGEWDQAEADFQRALELNPGQPQVLNYLGYTWVDQGVNLDQALGMIEDAIALRPRDGYIIDSLGWAYYRLGRYQEAVVELERAVNLVPDDPELNDHLGDAYWRVGREREATFQWRIAADVDEQGNVRARALEKLANGLGPVETTAQR